MEAYFATKSMEWVGLPFQEVQKVGLSERIPTFGVRLITMFIQSSRSLKTLKAFT